MNDRNKDRLCGELYVAGDGSFTVFDAEAGTFTKASERDRVKTRAEGSDEAGWRWTITLADKAHVAKVDLAADSWAALFEHPQRTGSRPSVSPSWCIDDCTSLNHTCGG
jgi:hypothetical protein